MAENYLWSNLFKKKHAQQKTLSDILKEIPLFLDLNGRELRKVEGICYDRFYKEGETIFYEGEPGTGMYVIKSGEVQILKKHQDKEILIATLSPGDFFGELALLDESPRSATARATVMSEIIGIFRPDLLDLVKRDPWSGSRILIRLSELIGLRLKEASDKLKKFME